MEPQFILMLYMNKYDLSLRDMAAKCDLDYTTIWRCLKDNYFSRLTAQKIEDGTGGEIQFEQLSKENRPPLYKKRLAKRESLTKNK